ncbi:glycosyltransferase [Paenibacillus campi]|uniref:glycosyltransferase n=1 Tax=Paenibacillus campi TaxID=3106031 RepID=UPI002B00370E|nr:glycosyltransferase [Paenibacillus sp. SGZ-1014]
MEFTGERFIPDIGNTELEVEHIQRYQSIVKLVQGKVVLDAACGEGYGSNILADQAQFVYGVDIDPESIVNAQKKYDQANLKFFTKSVAELPLENSSVDIVISFETIEHLDEETQHQFLKEIKRVLKPDGIVIMSTPDKYWYTDVPNHHNPYHMKEFYKAEFEDFLRHYFKELHLFYQDMEIVSFIGEGEVDSYHNLTLQDDGTAIEKGKYMIAIASDMNTNHFNISSIIFNPGASYQIVKERIMSLQDEVEERNQHIAKLDQHIEVLGNEIEASRTEISRLAVQEQRIYGIYNKKQELFQQINQLENEKQQLSQQLSETQALLNERQNELQQYREKEQHWQQSVRNMEGHIEQLLQQERILNGILNSKFWKLATAYYRTRDACIPPKSRRRIVAKLVKATIKNPGKMIRKINVNNIRNLKYYWKVDPAGGLEQRIDSFIEKNREIPIDQGLDIIKVDIDAEHPKELLIFPVYEQPLVSIVIPVYNQWEYTYSCLISILKHTPTNIHYEVIIADDCSTDETVNIHNYVQNVLVVRDGENRGFLLNCNNAAEKATGEYVFFLNNDTNVQENWLSSLLEIMEQHDDVGMVGSKLVYPDGRLQEAGGIIWNDASGWNYGRLEDPRKPEYNYVKEVDYISGAAILVRMELWKRLGGFDQRYVPAYFEDSDLAFGIRSLGYKVMLQPRSIVVHFEGISHGTDTGTGIKSYQVKNREKFIDKWQQELSQQYANGEHVFLARDRSQHKKTLLIVDHYVPHFDKDAGSKTIYQYIQYFANAGYNIKFIGDNFYQHEPYTTALQQLGVEVLYGEKYQNNIDLWIEQNGQYITHVFLNRPHISIKYIDTIRKYSNAKIIYYGHDLHYLREQREYELSGNKELLAQAERWKKTEVELFTKSDMVYYPSQVEIDKIHETLPEIQAKAIPAYIYDVTKAVVERKASETSGLLFVGGFGHKPNVDGVMWFMAEVFPHILQANKDIKFHIVGSNPPDSILELASESVIVHGFVSDEQLTALYAQCRIDVVPLRYGAGVKGKVVEALYNSIPIVTTTVGSEGLQEISDYLLEADEPEMMAKQIVDLYVDEIKLQQLSDRSLPYIDKYFSANTVKRIIADDFN